MSNEVPTDALRVVPDRFVQLATDAAWARNVDKATAMMVDLDDLYALLLAVKAAPASPLPGGGWQDIGTAPKDGTRFLWCRLDDLDGNAGMHIVFWERGEFRYASDHEKFVGDAVDSWMPLPAPPAALTVQKEEG